METFDSNYLLELARQRSAASRSELAAIISDLFSGEEHVLTERERILMYEIIHHVVRDAEMEIRKVISSRLADREDPPEELINLLANDEIEVAYPILTESRVLRDQTLIEIVRNRTLEHQMAVAIRHTVSPEVSDALVKTGNETVIRTLLQNENADLSEATMEFLIEQSQRIDSFHEPILRRKELGPEMAKRMYLWVSAALRKYIVDHCGLSLAEIDDLMEATVMAKVDDAVNKSESKSAKLAKKLKRQGEINSDLMIRALEDGEVRFFVNLVSEETGLRDDLVMRFVLEPGGEGLAVACKAMSFSDYEYQRVFTFCRKSRPTQTDGAEKSIAEAVKFFRHVDRDSADEVIRRWRRDRNYLSALRDLDMI